MCIRDSSLNDDLNTAEAIGIFFSFLSEINKKIANNSLNDLDKEKTLIFLKLFNSVFDVIDYDNLELKEIPAEVQDLVESRQESRKKLDWKMSDILRDKIESLGWHVEDTADGQKLIQKK